MQTFLPYPSFEKSAQTLDRLRLNKQGVEAYQILRTLLGVSSGWQNHPAVKMWKGHESALLKYALCMRAEWISRGYNDTLTSKLIALGYEYNLLDNENIKYPAFLQNPKFIESHRSNLLRKNPEFYGKFKWEVPPDLPYIWA